jgi:hypothetical protein
MGEEPDCSLEARERLPVGGALHGSGSGRPEMEDRLVPDFALGVVQAQRELMRFEVLCMECRERFGYAAVQSLAARWEYPAVDDLSHPVVCEIQIFAHRVEHVPSAELLHLPRRLLFIASRHLLEERKIEIATHDRGQRRQLAAPLAEPVELAADERADAVRDR